MKPIALTLLFLTLLGTGCVSIDTQELSPEEAAMSLSFSSGTQMTLRETVLGLGGKFVTFFKQEADERTIFIDEWKANELAKLRWERKLREETVESKEARQDYFAKYAAAPIGSELPNPPDPVYAETVQSGSLLTQALSDSTKVLLPLFWPVNEEAGDGSSLVWLSKKQYDELTQTRRTDVNLGLFDDSVSYAVGLTDQVKYFIEKIKGSDAAAEEKSVLQIDADISWTNYTLTIDGVTTLVRAIRAQNAFARYIILANHENPLILELMLSPAARGSLNLFSREALGEAFWGYEVVSVTRGESE